MAPTRPRAQPDQKLNKKRRSYPGTVRQPGRRQQIRQRRAEEQERDQLPTDRRLLKMIVSNLQPLEITEEKNFIGFAKTLNPTQEIPTTSTIRSMLLRVYEKEEKALRNTLAQANDLVLTCELWSSRPEDYYLSVGCHFVDKRGNLKSYMLKTTSLFGDPSPANIKKQLMAVMAAWGVTEKVHSVVRAGMPILEQAKWTDMPCFAHSLDVVFKDLMDDSELQNVLRKCQYIVRFFKDDSEAEKKLREIQRRLEKNQNELIPYSGSRWLTWLHMLREMFEQYPVMVMVFEERDRADLILNENEKKKIKNLISALEALEKATSTMKPGGFDTISVMLPVMKTLLDKLEKEERGKNDVARELLLKCRKEFGDVKKHKMAPITFLDPRYKNQLGGDNKQLAINKILQELRPVQTSTLLKAQLNQYERYTPNAESSNPLSWWRHTGTEKFGVLARLALKKLGVVSTAVPLERAFSTAGDQFCHLRSSIKPEDVNMMLFLNSNWSTES